MRKLLATLATAAALFSASAGASPVPLREFDPFVMPPYPEGHVFAVLSPADDHCGITLVRRTSINLPLPGTEATVAFSFAYLLLTTEVKLAGGGSIPTTFYFPFTAAYIAAAVTEVLPVACGQLSHLVITAAPCRLRGYDQPEERRFFVTYPSCVPDLPRRLEFFAEVPFETITSTKTP